MGGGLGHIQYIRDKAKNLSSDVEIVLIADKPQVFYAPAFEEVLAGKQPLSEAIIDLRKISTLAGVTFIQSQVEDVDTDRKLIKLAQRASIQFDFLSIEGIEVPKPLSSHEFHQAFYVKDYVEFFRKLKELEEELEEARPNPFNIAVIGGGETGVTVSRYLSERLRKYSPRLKWEVFEKNENILTNYQNQIRRHLEQELKSKDVLFHTQFEVDDVREGSIRDPKGHRKPYEADIVFIAAGSELPTWTQRSVLPLTSDGFFDVHPNLTMKNFPFVVAGGEAIGRKASPKDAIEHAETIARIVTHQPLASKKSFDKIKKRDTFEMSGKDLQVRWGFLKESEKLFQERQMAMKASLDHLRAVKEQKKAQLYPLVEENAFVDKLKKRLALDIPEQALPDLFSESLGHSHQIDGWFEREYKDVFNDHYLSSYHMGIDLLDQSFIYGGRPEYIRLYISAPSGIKDVEILSQIIIGAFRACNNVVNLKVHICGQAMNTVQFSMGAKTGNRSRRIPEPVTYLALTRPLGLYGLLSQQGKSIWEGQWLSEIWAPLAQSHQAFAEMSESFQKDFSVFQLSENGLINDLVKNLGTDGWRICVNLSTLPRWEGVDQILRQNPIDQLLEKNWQKGFRYWSGQGEKIPESQYLLWEPHLIRPASCLLIDPAHAHVIDRELRTKYQQKLHFVGYAEKTAPGQQTHYKLSDWVFEGRHKEASIEPAPGGGGSVRLDL